MITGFSHIYHRVRNLDETIDFYTKNLGFRLLRKFVMNGRPSAYVELGEVLLELGEADPTTLPGPGGERRLGFRATDIELVFAGLKANGVEILEEPRDARTFWGKQGAIKDPSGYVITIREWEPPDNPRYPDWQPRHEGVQRLA
jgi:catechol 2,3-dioxygenase-like lactoylglutathione lyase family enzyme